VVRAIRHPLLTIRSMVGTQPATNGGRSALGSETRDSLGRPYALLFELIRGRQNPEHVNCLDLKPLHLVTSHLIQCRRDESGGAGKGFSSWTNQPPG
jgi:hypothetical protein